MRRKVYASGRPGAIRARIRQYLAGKRPMLKSDGSFVDYMAYCCWYSRYGLHSLAEFWDTHSVKTKMPTTHRGLYLRFVRQVDRLLRRHGFIAKPNAIAVSLIVRNHQFATLKLTLLTALASALMRARSR